MELQQAVGGGDNPFDFKSGLQKRQRTPEISGDPFLLRLIII